MMDRQRPDRPVAMSSRRLVARIVLGAIGVTCLTVPVASQPPQRPEPPARSVTLPLAEYNRLLDLAARPTTPTPTPPAGAVLTSAELRVRVDRDAVRGQFALGGQVLREGVHRVSLLTGSTLVSGTSSGRPLPLVADGTGQAALVQDVGPFALSLEWATALVLQPGRASFVVPVPAAGTARATFDVPGDQADVRLSAGLITRRSTSNGRTVVDATLRPGTATEVSWSMRDSAPVSATREVRSVADVLTLVTLADADVRMVSLVDVTVVQGEPRTFEVRLPSGYELTSISGGSLDTSERRPDGVVVRVTDATLRQHQFLVSLERPHDVGSFKLDTGVATLPGVQRERGEIAVEGVGTLELEATEREGMHRIDVRELNPALQSLARTPLLSAFRYQRTATLAPGVALDVKRFADAGVLAAVADRAVATTMVTTEGRAITEVSLQVRNRAQPFLKVTLPSGATLASVEVAGESAKPVLGADGTRVPLLRPGFRPSGPYSVSYVYMHAATPFARRGDLQMALPRMDVPIGLVEWEVFMPDTYSVKAVDGNVIDRLLADRSNAVFDRKPVQGDVEIPVGSVAETITVEAESPRMRRERDDAVQQAPSRNVVNLQRRAAGVLPIRLDVPRTGTRHTFVKPLVVDQHATVTLRYKRR